MDYSHVGLTGKETVKTNAPRHNAFNTADKHSWEANSRNCQAFITTMQAYFCLEGQLLQQQGKLCVHSKCH